jgi:cysteinyl-tRNA synthetase
MIAGARVEVAPYKRDPMDFVLWKPSSDDQPGWDSPWGRGRPGWHIECSAMSHALLGDSFDIHGGGIDLQFPHHENEIAQSCCAHPEGGFAKIWMHNEMLQVEGKKMSKSLGNFFTVRDLLDEGVPGEVIRFVMLSTHYSKPMDWTEKKREEAEKTLKWREATKNLKAREQAIWSEPVARQLANDLNTPNALQVLNAFYTARDFQALKDGAGLLGLLTDTLDTYSKVGGQNDDLIAALLLRRDQARATKDFATADAIRDAFRRAGVSVMDSAEGTTWTLSDTFDPAKLEALQ